MSDIIKSDQQDHRDYAQSQGKKRLKQRQKQRVFASIEDYNIWANQPEPDEREDK